jgi:cytochrome c-type biogenesis protein CcmH
MIWLTIAALSLIAVLFVLAPLLWNKRTEVTDEQVTPSILVDQLDELERDSESGLIAESEANAAKLEIKRRIISAARRSRNTRSEAASKGSLGLVFCALLVPAIAVGYYAFMGSPAVPGIAFADREGEREEARKVAALVEQLLARLQSDPNGGDTEGWLLLGQTYMRLGRLEEAVKALEEAADRDDSTSVSWSMLAEALVRVDQGIVTPRAGRAIEKALELDPENPAAAFYKAIALSQSGRDEDAHNLLVARLEAASAFEPWMNPLIEQANRIGKSLSRPRLTVSDFVDVNETGPTAADMAAAMELSDEDRSDFIRSMVERLADRLKGEPDDLNGWLRLANAYTVLGEREQAIGAFERANELLASAPANDPRRLRVEQALADLKG